MRHVSGSIVFAGVLCCCAASQVWAQDAHTPTSELPPPFTVAVEAEARYAGASTTTSTSDAFVTRLMARWLVIPLLELRLDWGVAHVSAAREPSKGVGRDADVVVLGNPSLSVGLFLTDQSRPYASDGFTVEVVTGVSLPVSPVDEVRPADCARCNLAAMSNGGMQRWVWMPMTLAAWMTMSIRRGEPDEYFVGLDGTGSAMISIEDDDTGALGLEGGIDFGWNLGGDLVALGIRVQGMFASSDTDELAVGSLVPFVEIDLFDRAFVRADATIDLYSFEGAPWSTGVRAGFVY